jgi:hypothetical protein
LYQQIGALRQVHTAGSGYLTLNWPGSVSNWTGLGKRARFAHRAPGAYVIAHSIDDVQAIGL